MPTGELELQTIEGELNAVFSENPAYSSLNFEEVALAFRMNATAESATDGDRVTLWKGIFSLEYMANVLRRYLDIRGRLESKIEAEETKLSVLPTASISNPSPEQIAVTQFRHELDLILLLEKHYAAFLSQQLTLDFILESEYDYLTNKGMLLLNKSEKDTLMGIGKARRLAYLQDSAKAQADFKHISQVAIDFAKNICSPDEHGAIVREAKRLAVWNYFTSQNGAPLQFPQFKKNYP